MTAGSDIDAVLLRTLLAVAREESFVGAAAKLGVSQGTASVRIQKLEDRAGGYLFRRGNKRAATSLTGAGWGLRTEAEAFLALHDRIARRTDGGDGPCPT